MSELSDDERGASPETFPDWLAQIQSEYLQLTDLYGKEREYGQKLAELISHVQHEIGFPIPLNPIVLSAALPDIIEAQLGDGAIISYVDSHGNRGTRPLTLMPLETVIFTVHECTFRLKEMIAEKRRLMARRVRALDRVNLELDKACETMRYTRPDSMPELEKVDEQQEVEGEPEVVPGAGDHTEAQVVVEQPLTERVGAPVEVAESQPVTEPAPPVGEEEPKNAQASHPDNGFEFKGTFKEKRHLMDEKGWGAK